MNHKATTLLRQAVKHFAAADEQSWLGAEKVWRANKEEGATQVEIAAAMGKGWSQTTVSRHIAIWEAFRNIPQGNNRPPWQEAYDMVRGGSTKERLGNLRAAEAAKAPDSPGESRTEPEVDPEEPEQVDEEPVQVIPSQAAPPSPRMARGRNIWVARDCLTWSVPQVHKALVALETVDDLEPHEAKPVRDQLVKIVRDSQRMLALLDGAAQGRTQLRAV